MSTYKIKEVELVKLETDFCGTLNILCEAEVDEQSDICIAKLLNYATGDYNATLVIKELVPDSEDDE